MFVNSFSYVHWVTYYSMVCLDFQNTSRLTTVTWSQLIDNFPCFARIAFVGILVIRNIAFLCQFNCVICLVPCSRIIGGDCLLFLRKSHFLILHSNSLVIYGDRFLRTLFNLSGACLSTHPRNISFHSRHISFGSQYKSTLAHDNWLRSLKNFPLSKCLKCLVSITRGPLR